MTDSESTEHWLERNYGLSLGHALHDWLTEATR